MAIGLFGLRDIDKNVFRAAIVPYDAGNETHRALAAAVERAEQLADTVDISPAKTFQSARKGLLHR